MRIRWLIAALLLSVALAVIDRLFLMYYIYWRYPWSDTSLHLIGGAMLGVFAVGLFNDFRPRTYLAFVIVASLGWEAFEYIIGATTYGKSFLLDTSSDLLFDALGATLAYVIARYSLWRSV